MRQLSLVAAMIATVVVLISCASAPEASFTASPVDGNAPLNVQFTDTSVNEPTSWSWEFGDGGTSTEQSPSHEYEVAGTYTVTLRATNEEGTGTASVSEQITVGAGPLVRIAFTEDSPADIELGIGDAQAYGVVAFDEFDNEIDPSMLTIEWDAGDAGNISADGMLTAGTEAGAHEDAVSVTVRQGDWALTAARSVMVLPDPLDSVEIAEDDLTVAAGDEIVLTATAYDQYGNEVAPGEVRWEADSRAGAVGLTGSFTATTRAGDYSDALRVTVALDGVTRSSISPLTVTHADLAELSVVSSEATLPIGASASLTADAEDGYGNPVPADGVTYAVSGGGATVASGSLTAGTQAGELTLTGTLTVNGVTATDSLTVTVPPGPLATLAIAEASRTIEAGAQVQLVALPTDEYGNAISGLETEWDVTAGAVTEGGTYTGPVRAGGYPSSINVAVTQGATVLEAIGDVTVVPAALSQVVVLPDTTLQLGMGMTQQFLAGGADTYGNEIDDLTFTWTAASGGTITESGLFTATTTVGSYDDAVSVEVAHGPSVMTKTTDVVVEPDRISYLSITSEGNLQMRLMNSDGSGSRLVSGLSDLPLGINWFSNGRRLLVGSFAGSYAMDDEGTSQSLIGDSEYLELFPALSPDGTRVAVARFDPVDFQYDLYIIDLDGGDSFQLTATPSVNELRPQWSPDGTKILFDDNADVNVINVNGTGRVQLTDSPDADVHPYWSPDGSQVLFTRFFTTTSQGDLYVMNSDGTGEGAVRVNFINELSNGWTPDGRILFEAEYDDFVYDVWSIDPDGSDARTLTDGGEDGSSNGSSVWAPRKAGIPYSHGAIMFANSAPAPEKTVAQVTAVARSAVVRVVRDDGGSGSGFIFDASGLLLTNNHVVTGAESLTIVLNDGTEYEGTVVGRDIPRDLAVVRIEGATGPLPTLSLVEAGPPELGDSIVIAGHPLGQEAISITQGIVSSTTFSKGKAQGIVQTDAAVNPGNSGGPMLNLRGEVIGVVSSKLVGVSVEGVAFGISAATVRAYLDRMLAGEVIKH